MTKGNGAYSSSSSSVESLTIDGFPITLAIVFLTLSFLFFPSPSSLVSRVNSIVSHVDALAFDIRHSSGRSFLLHAWLGVSSSTIFEVTSSTSKTSCSESEVFFFFCLVVALGRLLGVLLLASS